MLLYAADKPQACSRRRAAVTLVPLVVVLLLGTSLMQPRVVAWCFSPAIGACHAEVGLSMTTSAFRFSATLLCFVPHVEATAGMEAWCGLRQLVGVRTRIATYPGVCLPSYT